MKFEFNQFLNPETDNIDEFGYSVSIGGGRIAVGDDDKDKVYIYNRSNSQFKLSQVIDSPVPPENPSNNPSRFGSSVDFYDGYLAIGRPGMKDKNPPNAATDFGMVFIYLLKGKKFVFLQKIESPGSNILGNFGMHLEMKGNFLFVGERFTEAPVLPISRPTGYLHIYEFSKNKFKHTQTLQTASKQLENKFGESMSFDSGYLIVGSQREDIGDNINSGKVTVYKLKKNKFEYMQELIVPNYYEKDRPNFGFTIDISNNIICASAPHESESFPTQSRGKVYIYKLKKNKFQLCQEIISPAPDSDNPRQFGWACVRLHDNYLFVSECFLGFPPSSARTGAVWIFKLRKNKFVLFQKIVTPPKIEPYKFGRTFSVENGVLVIGSDDEKNFYYPDAVTQGNVYIYYLKM